MGGGGAGGVIHVITMVPSLIPNDEVEQRASPQLQELREVLTNKYGGHAPIPILLGDATVTSSKALDPYIGPFDVLITRHSSLKEYHAAIQSDEYQQTAQTISKLLVFGFTNNSVTVDLVFPARKTLFQLTKEPIDTKQKAESIPSEIEMYQATGNRGLETYKSHVANHPGQKVFLISLHTGNIMDKTEVKNEQEYNKGWRQLAFSDNVKMILQGPIVSLDDGPKAFQTVTIAEYPSREIAVRWLESDYHTKLQEHRKTAVLDKFDLLCLPIYG